MPDETYFEIAVKIARNEMRIKEIKEIQGHLKDYMDLLAALEEAREKLKL